MKKIVGDQTKQLDLAMDRLIKKVYYFAQGDDLISIDIAVQIRALIHDTNNSKSLFKTLKLKSIDFIDSSNINYTFDWTIKESYFSEIYGLVVPTIVLPVNESKYTPMGISENFKLVKFQEWWEKDFVARIVINDQYAFLSRKEVILQMANKDGGAHYDMLSNQYSSFKDNHISTFKMNGEFLEISNSALYPTVVQIALEVMYSLIRVGKAKKIDTINDLFIL